ncbi:peritrophin-44-like [Anopheles albimanus]|uniref:peritrophin-44-like n=1 Tax=Anopheles albimanus TaxID=7167 RepID=UPI00163EA19D|nr:peritrophin-44-like [Anopheles albimanus]
MIIKKRVFNRPIGYFWQEKELNKRSVAIVAQFKFIPTVNGSVTLTLHKMIQCTVSWRVGVLVLLTIALAIGAFAEEACEGVPDGYFVQNKNDCQAYFYCRNETAQPNKCPDDFYFNELEQVCDYRDKVNCHLCQQQTGLQVLPHPKNCEDFIVCSEGYSTVGHCSEGYLFDSKRSACHPAARVKCNIVQCPQQSSNSNEIVYRPGARCDEYFICQSGTAIQTFCAPGLYWDSIKERCDLSQNVSCTL